MKYEDAGSSQCYHPCFNNRRKQTPEATCASVFYNQLKLNMPLQSCATVQFALSSWKTRLSLDDLKIDSPYNTYIVPDFRPAYCFSRLSSYMQLRPASSDYLLRGSKGGHIFSKTFREHQKAIASVQLRD